MTSTRTSLPFCVLSVFITALLSSFFPLQAHETSIDLYSLAPQADFIFKGSVVSVQYRNSLSVPLTDPCGLPVYEDGQPVLADGSNLPHTFVTYLIERIYKGKAPLGNPYYVTLRFLGGVDQTKPDEIFEVVHDPHMDVDDRDILFVKDNTVNSCPLVGSEEGRFRAIQPGPTGVPMMFTDQGHQVLLVVNPPPGRNEADMGPRQDLPEVLTNHFPGWGTIDTTVEEPSNEFSLPGQDGGQPETAVPNGPQFTESQFDGFLDYVVAQTHTPEELANLPPVVTANITAAFNAQSATHDTPTDYGPEMPVEYPRTWLDQLPEAQRNAILEQEREEQRLFELSKGNPVLPSTPCQMRILTEGPMTGDISGPLGTPDCYVNLYDLAELARRWLDCMDPENAACEN